MVRCAITCNTYWDGEHGTMCHRSIDVAHGPRSVAHGPMLALMGPVPPTLHPVLLHVPHTHHL